MLTARGAVCELDHYALAARSSCCRACVPTDSEEVLSRGAGPASAALCSATSSCVLAEA